MNILRFSLPVIQMFGLVVVVVGCGTQAHDMHVLDHQAESHAAMVIRHQTQNNAYVTFPQSNTLVIESLVTELTPRVGLPEIAAGDERPVDTTPVLPIGDNQEGVSQPTPTTDYTLGAFNIQTFGRSKMSDAVVAQYIATIVVRYDILLIQEIRDKSGESIEDLLELINQQDSGFTYEYIMSDRLGRSSYKEQYAFLYRSERAVPRQTYQISRDGIGGDDIYERPPFVVHFDLIDAGEDIALIPLHAKPDHVQTELAHLDNVYDEIVSLWDEEDTVLLGDFNADCSYLDDGELQELALWSRSEFHWHVGSDADTTTKSTDCAYDRIVTTGVLSDATNGDAQQVFDYGEALGLNNEEVTQISDHYPVDLSLTFDVVQ